MHRVGRYKLLNMIFGCFPFIGAVLITFMKVDSSPAQQWLSIVKILLVQSLPGLLTAYFAQIPLGFGNAVVLQTMLSKSLSVVSMPPLIPAVIPVALLVHLPGNVV
jgi:hypothetical protein